MDDTLTPSSEDGNEYALVVLKPDTIEKQLTITVLGIIEYEIQDIRRRVEKIIDKLPSDLLRQHYAHIANKPFYPDVEKFMQSNPVWAVAYEGRKGTIDRLRGLLGATDPREAEEGTLRHLYGEVAPDGTMRNVAHVSDSPEAALDEIKLFFTRNEVRKKLPELYEKLYSSKI